MKKNLNEVLFTTIGRLENDASLSSFRKSIAMNDFLTEYTLHDSFLELVIADEPCYFTLGIVWDGFWNKDRLGWTDKDIDLWPYLFITFPYVYKVNWTLFQGDTSDTILETSSQRIDVGLLEEELRQSIIRINKNRGANQIDMRQTQFKCLYGDLEVFHEDPVQIVCVNTKGELVNL